MTTDAATAEIFPQFPRGCHPLDQASLWGVPPLYRWQMNALRAVAQPFSRVALAVVNEGGKTATLGPCYILSVMTAFPGARCFCMSKSVSQTRDQMYEPMRQIIEQWPDTWSWTGSAQDMKITHANGSVCKFYAPSDPDNVEGYHNAWREVGGRRRFCPCTYWTDEDKGRDTEIFNRILRINPYFWLSTSSTGQAQGFFFEAISPDTLEVIPADDEANPRFIDAAYPDILLPTGLPNYNIDAAWQYRDMVPRSRCPHLMTEDAQRRLRAEEEKYGYNHPTIRAKRECSFSVSEDSNLIFERRHIEAMLRAMRGENKTVGGDVRFSCDVGGDAGSDDTVMMGRIGSEIVFIRDRWEAINEVQRAQEHTNLLRALRIEPHQLWIDGGGIGATVAKIMEFTHGYWGITRFMANNAAQDDTAYRDRYTELHWMLRELLEMDVLKLPYCAKLLRDMRERLFVEVDDRVKTQPKAGNGSNTHRAKYGHSPNHLDALIYVLADFPIDSIRAVKQQPEAAKVAQAVRDYDIERQRDATIRDGIFGGLPVLDALNIKV